MKETRSANKKRRGRGMRGGVRDKVHVDDIDQTNKEKKREVEIKNRNKNGRRRRSRRRRETNCV